MIVKTGIAGCLRPALMLVMAMAIGGCFFGKGDESCESVQEYQSAKTAPRLEVPQGVDKPDESAGLKVPEGPVPAEPLAKTAKCLQRPPNYFDKPMPGISK